MDRKAWEIEKLLEEKYNGEKTEGFFADCTRLEAGEPLAYVIGHVPFLHTTIYLDSHPLIPRPETEYWTEKAIESIQNRNAAPPRILDLCAGSGCVGVAVLTAVPEATVDFIEIDTHHHSTIRKNIEHNKINAARAHIYDGDLFENVEGTYDYILTNPPYVDPALDRVEESVRTHEPSKALYGGTHGLKCIKAIIEKAPHHLAKDGMLFLEHEPEQTKDIETAARRSGLASETHLDQYSVERYTQLNLKEK